MDSHPVSEHTRNAVWQGMLDAQRLVIYYQIQTDQYIRRNRAMQVALLAFGGIEVSGLFFGFSNEIHSLIGGSIAILVALTIHFNFAKKSAILQVITRDCSALELQWQTLWSDLENSEIDGQEARHRNENLKAQLLVATERAPQADIASNQELNQKCTETAYITVSQRYAIQNNG